MTMTVTPAGVIGPDGEYHVRGEIRFVEPVASQLDRIEERLDRIGKAREVSVTRYDLRLNRIEEKLDRVLIAVGAVEELISKIEPHLDKLGPLIEEISNSAIVKMLTGGKKK